MVSTFMAMTIFGTLFWGIFFAIAGIGGGLWLLFTNMWVSVGLFGATAGATMAYDKFVTKRK